MPPVTAFETGTNAWRRLPSWPAGCASGCSLKPTPLYLAGNSKAGFQPPKAGDAPFQEYVSDPARPVPFVTRTVPAAGFDRSRIWKEWLVSDQREASGRTDVAVFTSDVLIAPVVSEMSAVTTNCCKRPVLV